MTHILYSAFFFTVSASLYIKIPQSNFIILISILQLQLIPNKKEKRKTKQLTSYSLRSPFTSTKTNNPTTPKPSESPSFSPNPIPTSPLHSYLLYLISLSLLHTYIHIYLGSSITPPLACARINHPLSVVPKNTRSRSKSLGVTVTEPLHIPI